MFCTPEQTLPDPNPFQDRAFYSLNKDHKNPLHMIDSDECFPVFMSIKCILVLSFYFENFLNLKNKTNIIVILLTVFEATVALVFRIGLDGWLILKQK